MTNIQNYEKDSGMIVIEAETERDLLTVTYCGHVEAAEFEEIFPEFEKALGLMKPGFRLLTDLGGLEAMDFNCARHIEKFMNMINARGVSTVVRIVPDPKKDIGFRVMSYFHYGKNVNIVTCENMEEAQRALID
jgi:hypothetical protein